MNEQWLVDGGLIYTLKDGTNHYEINVTMANGSRETATRNAFAIELLGLLSSQSQIEAQWQTITAPGQVKVGDFVTFNIGDEVYYERVKVVLNAGTDKEELIYNKKRNYYLITSMAIVNTGSQKNVRYRTARIRALSSPAEQKEGNV